MKNLQTQIAAALLLTLTFFFTHALRHDSEYSDEYKRDNSRDRRESAVAGLIPFPRVGRSGINSALQMDNLYDTQRELRSHKREGLIPFPRIGRRSESKNTALWFGPRLGRSIVIPESYDTSYMDSDTPTIIKTLIEMKSKNFGDEDDSLM
ncbi:cardio acceleratory peptide 2b-like [Metopolophium dirhodum]|uniref:cardio acceleratory peptide 2b-like n=1 Tax=Metopolophium dirhodum TaxID=44670 RepID=UPI00298F5C63|nr:cardio acceleratory peptide 2b-like [Metopolophium dirhodum]